MRVQVIVRSLVALGAVIVACGSGKDAAAGIVVTSVGISSASYEILGFANGPANKVDLKSGVIPGTSSASASTTFDSGDGFKGQVGSSTSLSHTIGFNNLTVTSSIASSMLFQNLSPIFPDDFPNASTQVTVKAIAQMQFHTDEGGKAVVSWDGATSIGSTGPWFPGADAQSTSTFMGLFRDDLTEFMTLNIQTSTDGVVAEVLPFSLAPIKGQQGNSIDLSISPGDYTIFMSTETVLATVGPGFYLNPAGSRIDATFKIVTTAVAPVPEPGSLTLALCGTLGVAGVMAARRRK